MSEEDRAQKGLQSVQVHRAMWLPANWEQCIHKQKDLLMQDAVHWAIYGIEKEYNHRVDLLSPLPSPSDETLLGLC